MTDATTDARMRAGSPADRKASTANAAATGAVLSLTLGIADWLFLQCLAGGHFHWAAPNQQLIEMASPIIFLPIALWIARVFSLIGDIITNRLQKDAGP